MTRNQEWFTTYEPRDVGTILMGNNTPCKIIGFSSVIIKMHDGIIITLEGVQYNPNLGWKLIFISIFDNKGYTYSGRGRALKIAKGSLIMMKGRLRHAKLYVLEDSITIGDASITSSEFDKYYTWAFTPRPYEWGWLGGVELKRIDKWSDWEIKVLWALRVWKKENGEFQ